jgi:ferric-dicitrate binding protein FerR (iron transport regulator)
MEHIVEKYLQGKASAEEKQALLKLLGESPEAREAFLNRRAELGGYNRKVSAEEVEAALERFEQTVAGRKAVSLAARPRLAAAMRVAAAVVLLLLAGLGGYYMGQNRAAEKAVAAASIVHCFAMGRESKGSVTLPDGTLAWLNADSRLTYPEEFGPDSRLVKLEGEGYFDVRRDEARPFMVETKGMKLKALGTAFDLRNYAGGGSMSAVLLNGSVEVSFDGAERPILLQPNQSVVYNKLSDTYELKNVKAADYVIWTNDRLLFDDEKLSVILYKMERWYGIEITAAGNVPGDMRLSLTIRKESKEDIFRIIEMIAPVLFSGEGDNIKVTGRPRQEKGKHQKKIAYGIRR